MYFITLICEHDLSSRTVGYYKSKKTAIEVVKENVFDIWETVYEYAVIQKMWEGLYPDPLEETWFVFRELTGQYSETEKPEQFEHYQFGIG